MEAVRQLLALVRNLLTWWVIIAPWEQAVRVRGGGRVALLGAGIHLRVPILDRVFQQSTRRRSSALPPQTLITRDGKPLTVAVMVGYQIDDLLLLYRTVHHAEGTIHAEIMGAIGQFVTSNDARSCAPPALAGAVAKLADLERFGLGAVTVTVTSFAYVRTYRLITGEGHTWNHGDTLDTDKEKGAAA
jgi:SPFH domain/Band 7 family protein